MSWITVVFMDGDEADEAFHLLYDIDGVVWSGPYAESIERTVEHLSQWDYGEESEHTVYDTEPWGSSDRTIEHDEYVLAWNTHLGYISLSRRVSTPVERTTDERHTRPSQR